MATRFTSKWVRDVAERVAWTAAQGALGVVTVEAFDLPVAWVPVVAALLAYAKGVVARRVGDPNSASTVL